MLLTWVVTALLIVLPLKAYSISPTCSLCIVDVQTQGFNSTGEDYIIVANNTDNNYDLSGVIIKYWTASGTPNSKIINLFGNLPAHNTLSFVSDSLKSANPSLSGFPTGLALADQGGTLRLIKGAIILDEISWGIITDSTFTGTTAPAHPKGSSLVRKQDNYGLFLDSDINSNDFEVSAHPCNGLSLNEIQPMLINGNGGDITPALEIVKATGANLATDCPILINSSLFALATGDLQTDQPLGVIENVVDVLSDIIPVPLNADFANTLEFWPASDYGNVTLPIINSLVTQPVLLADQTYSKFSSSWKATYAVTLGSANKLQTVPSIASSNPLLVPSDACTDAVIDEIIPNPVGDDTGNEWLELTTTTDQPAFLGYCGVVVNGTQYKFGSDEFLSPNQYSVYYDFSDSTSIHSLSLKNSGVSTVSWGRFDNNGVFVPLQTFQYQDAPEGQSWARFDGGWRWLATPTPELDNSAVATDTGTPQPTEFPVPDNDNNQPTDSPNTTSPVIISELLPNPASPQTDEINEYVELYNPSSSNLDLTGYKVQTGSSYSYSYTIQNQSIPAGEYLVLTSGDTNLSLANASGQARLIDSNGTVISQTDPYSDAPEGEAWAKIDGTWQWTGSPTAGATNVYTQPTVSSGSTKSNKKSTKTKKKTTKKKAAKKPKSTKSKTNAAIGSSNDNTPLIPGSLHTNILAGVGVLAVGYAAYEYRHDIANRLYQFRRYRKTRRTSGLQTTGR